MDQWNPPPQPPQPPGLRQRFGSLPLLGKLGIGCGGCAALLVICFIGLAALGAITGAGKTRGTGSTPTVVAQETVTANPTARPTPTPKPSGLLDTATLGGTEAAFQSAYGSPTGAGTAKTYTFSQGLVTATSASDASPDGTNHVASLRIGPSSGSWDATTATPICAMFLPADAKFINTQQVSGDGPERVYQSADLAKVFPADDANGQFSMELGSGFPGNTGCIIILGT